MHLLILKDGLDLRNSLTSIHNQFLHVCWVYISMYVLKRKCMCVLLLVTVVVLFCFHFPTLFLFFLQPFLVHHSLGCLKVAVTA